MHVNFNAIAARFRIRLVEACSRGEFDEASQLVNDLGAVVAIAAGKWDENKHPRYPAGHPLAGQFMKASDPSGGSVSDEQLERSGRTREQVEKATERASFASISTLSDLDDRFSQLKRSDKNKIKALAKGPMVRDAQDALHTIGNFVESGVAGALVKQPLVEIPDVDPFTKLKDSYLAINDLLDNGETAKAIATGIAIATATTALITGVLGVKDLSDEGAVDIGFATADILQGRGIKDSLNEGFGKADTVIRDMEPHVEAAIASGMAAIGDLALDGWRKLKEKIEEKGPEVADTLSDKAKTTAKDANRFLRRMKTRLQKETAPESPDKMIRPQALRTSYERWNDLNGSGKANLYKLMERTYEPLLHYKKVVRDGKEYLEIDDLKLPPEMKEDRQNPGLRGIQIMQGFDTKPHIETEEEIKDHIRDGDVEMFRSATKEDYKGFMSGDLTLSKKNVKGSGMHSHYVEGKFDRHAREKAYRAADAYGFRRGNTDLRRLALRKESRVVEAEDLDKISRDMHGWVVRQQLKISAKRKLYETLHSNPNSEEKLELELMDEEFNKVSATWQLLSDKGALAAAMGYDAIIDRKNKDMVVLNRSAVRIQNKPLTQDPDHEKNPLERERKVDVQSVDPSETVG